MTALIFREEVIQNKTVCRVFGIITFVILTGLGAFVRIPLPFSPVPITLQTFFVLLSGAILGKRLGVAAQSGYLALGVSGLPIFAGAASGISYLLGPTGGYVLGFVLANFLLANFLRYAKENLLLNFCLFCLADIVILTSGVAWLRIVCGYPLHTALSIGFIPFIPGDMLKALAAASIYLKLKTRTKEIFEIVDKTPNMC